MMGRGRLGGDERSEGMEGFIQYALGLMAGGLGGYEVGGWRRSRGQYNEAKEKRMTGGVEEWRKQGNKEGVSE